MIRVVAGQLFVEHENCKTIVASIERADTSR